MKRSFYGALGLMLAVCGMDGCLSLVGGTCARPQGLLFDAAGTASIVG
ncbi:MAG: hypothetical protein AAGD10_08445 [Myxococcota bacterium]